MNSAQSTYGQNAPCNEARNDRALEELRFMKNPQCTLEARRHIAEIYSYIKNKNPLAAAGVVIRIRLTVRSVGLFPRMGRVSAARNTHELLII